MPNLFSASPARGGTVLTPARMSSMLDWRRWMKAALESEGESKIENQKSKILPGWPCLAAHEAGVTLEVKVQPNAARSEPAGMWQNRLKVRIKAPAVEGKANATLRKWATEFFGLKAQDVEILRGEKTTTKTLLLRGVTLESAAGKLGKLE